MPATWKAGEPPENGDGLVFTSPDGQASIIVSGMLNIDDTLAAAFASREEPFDGETVTCRRHFMRFDVRTGICPDAPSWSVESYPVRIQDGVVEVGL